MSNTITLALTGASGIPYGWRLLECLLLARKKVYLLISKAAYSVISLETELKLSRQTSKLQNEIREIFDIPSQQLQVFDCEEWTAPIASGSNTADAMVVCPCSSGTLAALANGMSNNLIERAADVILKEQKKLILVHRETPVSAIHLENMLKLARMNVTIMPAAPGFYHQPETIAQLVDFIVARVLDKLEIEHSLLPRWGLDL